MCLENKPTGFRFSPAARASRVAGHPPPPPAPPEAPIPALEKQQQPEQSSPGFHSGGSWGPWGQKRSVRLHLPGREMGTCLCCLGSKEKPQGPPATLQATKTAPQDADELLHLLVPSLPVRTSAELGKERVRGAGGGSRQGAGLGHTRKKKGPGNQGPTARRNRRDCRNHSCSQLIARLQRPNSLPGPGSLSASRVSSSSTLATNRRAETTSCDELFQDSGHMCCNQGRKRITFWIQFPWVPSIYCGCGCAVQRCVLLVCR